MAAVTARCVIYVRISKDDLNQLKRDPVGLKRKVALHRAECERYAADQGWTIAAVFDEDKSVSASKFTKQTRTDYLRLLQWIEQDTDPTPVIVLTTEMERLYRQVEELLPLIKMAERTQLRAIQCTNDESFDLSTANGIWGAIGQVNNAMRESAKLSERQRRRQKQRAIEGAYQGPRPFGYRLVPDDRPGADPLKKRLVVDDDEAAELRDAAARVIAGASLRSIHLDWVARGVKTTRGNLWNHTEIRRMLLNPHYIGKRVHRPATPAGRQPSRGPGDMHDADWEPILDQRTFDALERIILDPSRRNRQSHDPVFLLAGVARCGECGARMVARQGQRNGRGKKNPIYMCPPAPGGHQCVGRAVPATDRLIETAVVHWLRPGGAYEKALSQQRSGEEIAPQIAKVLADQSECERWLKDYLDDYRNRLITADEYRKVKEPVEERRDELKRLAVRLSRQTTPTPKLQIGMTHEDWQNLTIAQQREHVEILIDRVVIHRTQRGRLKFDPGKVDVIPGSWAADAEPALLEIPFAPPPPLLAETALAYIRANPSKPVSPSEIARAHGYDNRNLAAFSRPLKELEARGEIVMIQQGAGRMPTLYVLPDAILQRKVS